MKFKTTHRGIRTPIPSLLAVAILLSACTIAPMGTSIPEAAAPADQTPFIVREEPLTPESTSPTVAPPSKTGTTMTYGEMTFILSPAIADGASGSEMPRIDVYPAQDYAELVPAAFESIHRLNNLLGNPSTIPAGQLPGVPFFNSQAVFASNIEKISFQNGSGVRSLTS